MPSNKIILGLVGEMAAGKTTVTNYLKEQRGAVSFRFSDMLRDVLKRVHVEETRSNLQTLSTILRQNFGEDLLSKVIAEDARSSEHPLIITEGVRRPTDITYLKELPAFRLVALQADERVRFERLTARSENPDDQTKTWEQFQQDGEQEPEQQIRTIARAADFTVDNNGTKEQLFQQIDEVLSKIKNES